MFILLLPGKKCARKDDGFLWSDFDAVIYRIKDFTPKLAKKVTFLGSLCKNFVMCAKI